jgi:hypothetical protein
MEVLKDGTVIIAGPSEAADVTFFHRKASCAGWAAAEDDWALMPGVKARQVAAPIPANSPPAKAESPSLLERMMANRLLVFAVAGLMVLHILFRFITVSPGITSILRFLVYGALLVVGVQALFARMTLMFEEVAEDCSVTACLNAENGLLRSVPSLEKDGAMPTVPCEYVGTWQAIGPGSHKERYVLKDDGTYSTQPPAGYTPVVFTGHWMVQGDKLVWRHKPGGFSELDINHIVSHSETDFELIERNGWHIRFNLIERISSKKCGGLESTGNEDGR